MVYRTERSLLVLVLLLLNSCSFAEPIEWHMVNVNYHTQGDAHLLIDGSVNVLIDAGAKYAADQALIPYLKSQKVNNIDHFFISHPHTDHYGGLESMLDAGIKISNIYYNLPPEGIQDWDYKRSEFLAVLDRAQRTGSTAGNVRSGFSLRLPTSNITVLYAHNGSKLKNGRRASVNDYSIIMRWDAGDFRTLFTGDLDEPLGRELAEKLHFKADILKVPHHGVTSVAPNAFFDVVSPKLNMFPSSKALWFHPRISRVKTWTLESNIYYCNNGLNGNVVLQITGSEIIGKSDTPSSDCPNGKLDITPGEKINPKTFAPLTGALKLILDE